MDDVDANTTLDLFFLAYSSLNEMLTMLNKQLGTNVKATFIKMPINNYVMETLADTTNLKEKLSYTPKITLEEGIKLITK